MHKENIENFSKKEKTKYFDMLLKNIEIFLKISNILRWYKKIFFKYLLVCQKKFEKKYVKDKKQLGVRDHCHYTKEYRDSGHSIYKLIYSLPKKNFYSFS